MSIQILNIGIQAFNTGKNEGIVSDNYYDQLKNISSLINTILAQQQMNPMMPQQMNPMMQQQMMQEQMMQQQMMQQQMMQQQMMQQQMMQQQMEQQIMLQQMGENMNMEKPKKLNVIFFQHPSGLKFNLAPNIGTKIKDLLDKFSEKIGAPKNNFIF